MDSDLSHPMPESEEDEDYIDTGAAILAFYCTLVDLLGRCAPDGSVIALVQDQRIKLAHYLHTCSGESLMKRFIFRAKMNH